MKFELKCKRCENDLKIREIVGLLDCDGTRVPGLYCPECHAILLAELEQNRIVEVYKDNKICQKDGKYYPYWGCRYYFDNLEDAKQRIDHPEIAIVSRREINEFLRIE